MSKRFLERQDEIFDSKLRKILTFGARFSYNYEMGIAGVCKLVDKVPSLLLHGSLWEARPQGSILSHLPSFACKQLSVAVASSCISENSFAAGINFPKFCSLLGAVENLEAVWIVPELNFPSESSKNRPNLELLRQEISAACRELRYLKIGVAAWRLHRSGQQTGHGNNAQIPRAERLDRWEDEVECPRTFHSPQPLQRSHESRHIAW